jgi:hypothetical protein
LPEPVDRKVEPIDDRHASATTSLRLAADTDRPALVSGRRCRALA